MAVCKTHIQRPFKRRDFLFARGVNALDKSFEKCKKQTEAQIAKIEKNEKDKIAGIDALYSAKHKKWEKAIVERVFSEK